MRRIILLALFPIMAHANCFLDGANIVRCGGATNGSNYEPVSWPVFTAETPIEVQKEMDERYGHSVPPYHDTAETDLLVKTVPIGQGDKFPDVICLKYTGGGQTCFNTMEITER